MAWGGCLELYSDPRSLYNQMQSVLPLFNRCVIFETNEYSWHGFSKIKLSPDKQDLSRKSLSIYLYTKERPQAEIAPPHTTFYIHRPLPHHIQPGQVLNLLKRRDDLIHYYQQRELQESGDFQSLKAHIKRYLAIRHSQLWQVWRWWLAWKNSQ